MTCSELYVFICDKQKLIFNKIVLEWNTLRENIKNSLLIDQSFMIYAQNISEIKTLKHGNDWSWQMTGWLWCPVVMLISSTAQQAPRPPGFLQNGKYEMPDILIVNPKLKLLVSSLPKERNVTTWQMIVKKVCILDWLLILFFVLHFFPLCCRVDGVEEVQFEMSKIKQKSEFLFTSVYQTGQIIIVNNLR